MLINADCRHYVGRKPCIHHRPCEDCPHYDPIQKRLLVIKLGALGDLLRTTPLLSALKKQYPGCQITWITEPKCLPLLQGNPHIDQVWATDEKATSRLLAQSFDVMICLDKDSPAPELATLCKAPIKMGFGLSDQGALIALNQASRYALELGIDDDLKFKKNEKTYQAIIHEMAELEIPRPMPPYQILLTTAELEMGQKLLMERKKDHLLLGVNPGAGAVFATKKWHWERYVAVLQRLHKSHKATPVLLGGSDEKPLLDRIEKTLAHAKVPVIRPGESFNLREFASIVAGLDAMVSGDTLAMHLALAFNVPTTIIFTSTCSQEIELYGLAETLIGQAPCAPCYLSRCKQPSQYCADSITVDDVVSKIVASLTRNEKTSETICHRSHI